MDYLNKILMRTVESSCRSALDSEVYKTEMIPEERGFWQCLGHAFKLYPPLLTSLGSLSVPGGSEGWCACSLLLLHVFRGCEAFIFPWNLTSIQDARKEIVRLNFSLMCHLPGLWFCGLDGGGELITLVGPFESQDGFEHVFPPCS